MISFGGGVLVNSAAGTVTGQISGQPTSHNKKCKKHKKKHKSGAVIAKKCKKRHHH